MKTKCDRELREKVVRLLAAEAERLSDEAFERCPAEFDAATEAAYAEVNDELTGVIRQLLETEVAYCVASAAFWDRLAQVLSFKAFVVYPAPVLADGVTDRQLAGKRSAIEKGDLAALKPLARAENKFVAPMDDAYQKQKQILGNLGYAFFVLAHLAKRYGSREAGEKFLRVASVSQQHARAMPIRFEEGQLDELISFAKDGIDALKVAADYAALGEWEPFRRDEAAKFAAEERRVAARKAKA